MTGDGAAVRELLGALEGWQPDTDGLLLDRVVGRTSAAIDGLVGSADEVWVEELRSSWWRLEHVNALALGDDRTTLRVREVEAVAEARDELIAMLRTR